MWGRKGSAAAALRHPHPRPAAPAGALPFAPCHLEKFKAGGHGDGGRHNLSRPAGRVLLVPKGHACLRAAGAQARTSTGVCVRGVCKGRLCHMHVRACARVCVFVIVCVRGEGSGAGGREGGSPAAPAHPPRRGERRLTGSPWSLKVKLRLVS